MINKILNTNEAIVLENCLKVGARCGCGTWKEKNNSVDADGSHFLNFLLFWERKQ